MANEEPNAEIEQLREQLAALKREREAAERSNEPETDEKPDVESVEEQESAAAGDDIIAAVDEISDDVVAQFKEFVDALDEDLRNTRPSTLLIVFALGILIGRLR